MLPALFLVVIAEQRLSAHAPQRGEFREAQTGTSDPFGVAHGLTDT